MLTQFYKEMQAWVDAGFPTGSLSTSYGLCTNLRVYVWANRRDLTPREVDDRILQLLGEMQDQFRAAGLDPVYPFNVDFADSDVESISSTKYTNPKRLDWIKRHATTYLLESGAKITQTDLWVSKNGHSYSDHIPTDGGPNLAVREPQEGRHWVDRNGTVHTEHLETYNQREAFSHWLKPIKLGDYAISPTGNLYRAVRAGALVRVTDGMSVTHDGYGKSEIGQCSPAPQPPLLPLKVGRKYMMASQRVVTIASVANAVITDTDGNSYDYHGRPLDVTVADQLTSAERHWVIRYGVPQLVEEPAIGDLTAESDVFAWWLQQPRRVAVSLSPFGQSFPSLRNPRNARYVMDGSNLVHLDRQTVTNRPRPVTDQDLFWWLKKDLTTTLQRLSEFTEDDWFRKFPKSWKLIGALRHVKDAL